MFGYGRNGIAPLFALPAGFAPRSIVSHRNGTIYVFGRSPQGHGFATWSGSGAASITLTGGINRDAYAHDLAEDGCTVLRASGDLYRMNICTGPYAWERWLTRGSAYAVTFVPGGRILVKSDQLELLDAASGAVIREQPLPFSQLLAGLSPDGTSFWTFPLDCQTADMTLRRYDLATGGLLAEEELLFGGDLAHAAAVKNGWRAALAHHHHAVPLAAPATLVLIAAVLGALAVLRLR